ncbi:hypothetical protein H6A37_05735 [Phocaeicola plebeius]|jgi:hypothetical protein|uniref:hypothetical protein n=1 Tax=Phocaeicola plebeius TaxID=310297 RepID=UPI001958ED83|nr:hypothetical protein [Phocaeicola plebeius]MBM6963334.1 hypothetical protein [Phocaeicola plebeius]
MHAIVPIIIIVIIVIQLFFFTKNFSRMRQFSNIFVNNASWHLRHNEETSLVDGIYGNGNGIFTAIIASINKYLEKNSGSVIDFGLLKDAVDRHCDSVENDIATQTPIPLYWGLAGTMAGVIIGLWDLLQSNAIMTLMSSSGEVVINNASQNAASGINSLLSGVAWAMLASICGILLTTANSLLFKKCKLKEEDGKNSFLAWMQSELLPELPSNTSEALNSLVRNLNKFNNTFAQNTTNLGNALNAVNQSYAIQADIIKAVHDMDIMKMAKANVRVLEELQQCTDKLEKFNLYLNDVEGYTKAIHRFESLYHEQVDKIHILEEIRDFFGRHKGEIAKTTADADRILQESLQSIRESTSLNVDEFHKYFVEQSEVFKAILKTEQEELEQFTSELKDQFNIQMSNMPQVAKRLEDIAAIPIQLDKLIDKIEYSNVKLANDISQSVKQSLMSITSKDILDDKERNYAQDTMPNWMKISGWIALIIIAIVGIMNIVFTLFPINNLNV